MKTIHKIQCAAIAILSLAILYTCGFTAIRTADKEEPMPTRVVDADTGFTYDLTKKYSGWEDAYSDILLELYAKAQKDEFHADLYPDMFALVQVDGDDVPELLLINTKTAQDETLITYAGDAICVYDDLYNIAVSEKTGVVLSKTSTQITAYTLKSGRLTADWTGEWPTPGQHLWNGEEVSARRYQNLFEKKMPTEILAVDDFRCPGQTPPTIRLIAQMPIVPEEIFNTIR